MTLLRIFNRQKSRRVDRVALRQIGLHLLKKSLNHSDYEIGVHLIAAEEMAELNETFLGHAGSTDVITFNHQENDGDSLHGEIFICIDDAEKHARQFHQTWQSEIVRYLVHGLLHLEGHDDLEPGARRAMKREENKLVKELSRRFEFGKLERTRNGSAKK